MSEDLKRLTDEKLHEQLRAIVDHNRAYSRVQPWHADYIAEALRRLEAANDQIKKTNEALEEMWQALRPRRTP